MNTDTNPLVTCLCLTKNRREWLPKAIDCFLKQTYEPRELLIVADGILVVDLLPDDPRIHLMHEEGVVGHKRNVGCAKAGGQIIAVWDDDDYSVPARLTAQVGALLESGKAVTAYARMKFTDGRNWWQYRGANILATSLLFRREWWLTHRFKEIQCGQDEMFASAALAAGQLLRQPDADLMYATNHPGNTWDRSRLMGNRGTWTPLPRFEWRDGPCAA